MRRLLVLVFLAFSGPVSAQPAMLVLDASISMWGRLEGRSKAEAARDAVAALMARWPEARPVGLVAYGHRRAQDCSDAQLLRLPAPDAGAVARQARHLRPRGRTPIAESLRLAAEALGPDGGSIILLTDGIESCHPDPCDVAQGLARAAPRLVLHAIAFDLADPPALAQLRCMAEATGGRLLTARTPADLATALEAAAAAPTPGPRAASPRAEPVPQPSLIVTLRLCPACDPMTGEATIILRRGEEEIARDGSPFGRFHDLPPGDYAVLAETPGFRRGPVAVSVPPSGTGRLELVLDAGWLLGGASPDDRITWQVEDMALPGGPPALLPAGRHRIAARFGAVAGAVEATVVAGDIVEAPIRLAFGTLRLQREGFGGVPRVVIAPAGAAEPIYADWPEAEVAAIPLPPGRYRVTADREALEGVVEVVIVDGAESPVVLAPQ